MEWTITFILEKF